MPLDDFELKAAMENLEKAKASFACDGLYLTAEQEAMFRVFEEQRLTHAERRRRIIARYQVGVSVLSE